MKCLKTIALACLITVALGAQKPAPGEWRFYGGDVEGRRYSPLTQINAQNVSTLKLAWQYGVQVVPPGPVVRGRDRQFLLAMKRARERPHAAGSARWSLCGLPGRRIG